MRKRTKQHKQISKTRHIETSKTKVTDDEVITISTAKGMFSYTMRKLRQRAWVKAKLDDILARLGKEFDK